MVTLCECIARDGLQHEPSILPTADKLRLIGAVAEAGFARIEATSYAHPNVVPAFADASDVLAGLKRNGACRFKATAPNMKAVERALEDRQLGHGAEELSLLVSASEGHSQRNLRASRAEQWERVEAMSVSARGAFRLVGVVSTAFACPFDGPTDPAIVVADAARFAGLGCDLVTIGDTTGHATPARVRTLFAELVALDGVTPVAHFHDTRGTGLANCLAALETGCTHFDSAIGGTGGNPAGIAYGEGYTGNVATEDLVNMLEADGIDTGVDWDALMRASELAASLLGRPLEARSPRAGRSMGWKG
jgi:hydroxymethylglutaryl-CoA lyase